MPAKKKKTLTYAERKKRNAAAHKRLTGGTAQSRAKARKGSYASKLRRARKG